MPHDRNGRVLEPGDIVNVVCRVRKVYAGDNVNLETIGGSTIVLDARHVERIVPPEPQQEQYVAPPSFVDQVERVAPAVTIVDAPASEPEGERQADDSVVLGNPVI